ncbi:MAG: GNAT family protein [Betaproteobacteria bacterium]
MQSIITSLPRCSIRSWRTGDERSLVENADNRNVWLNLLDAFPHPYTDADAKEWIAASSTADPEQNFAVEYLGFAIGGVGLTLHDGVLSKTGSFGYWIGERYWRKGIATAVVEAFVPHVFSEFALVRLEARVFSWNPGSSRVLEKCGFRKEALLEKRIFKDGRIIDEYVFARIAPRGC